MLMIPVGLQTYIFIHLLPLLSFMAGFLRLLQRSDRDQLGRYSLLIGSPRDLDDLSSEKSAFSASSRRSASDDGSVDDLLSARRRRKIVIYVFALTMLVASGVAFGMTQLLVHPVSTSFHSTAEDTVTKVTVNDSGSNDTGTDCVQGGPYSALPRSIVPIDSLDAIDDVALDGWISTGQLPHLTQLDLSKHSKMDGIISWVNGSDARHRSARDKFSQDVQRVDLPTKGLENRSVKAKRFILALIQGLQNDDKRFRDQNELLYSARSATKSLNKHLRTLHIISTDYWNHDAAAARQEVQELHFEGRAGQVPSWLNITSDQVAIGDEKRGKAPALRLHHDWDTFAPLVKTCKDLQQWKMERLPSFNSIAAEAVLGVNMTTLSENSFLASDDMFMGASMSTADFYTPLYGPVLHLDLQNMVQPSQKPWAIGEMAGLKFSVALLQKRFGTRQFPYPVHIQKSLNKPLLLESRMMWAREFEDATSARFRGNGLLANSHMLLNGLIVERHREALLWSFLVARVDMDGDGQINDVELSAALKQMRVDRGQVLYGRMRKRTTVSPDNVRQWLASVSFPQPEASIYTFSSMDGYPLSVPSKPFSRQTGIFLQHGPPRSLPSDSDNKKQKERFSVDFCGQPIDVCLNDGESSPISNASQLFTRFAFERPECGDCLIMRLVHESGESGLDAFLPPPHRSMPSSRDGRHGPPTVPAHLPLESDWKDIDFSLATVISNNRPGWSRRSFATHLIQRYSYIIASAPARFEQLTSPSNADLIFRRLRSSKPAFICINDDIRWKLDQVQRMFKSFLEDMWPASRTRLPYERL